MRPVLLKTSLKKKRLVIPVFIPFAGCAHRCVFCDQFGITGARSLPDAGEVARIIEGHLSTWKGGGAKEVAFYGGSFTALSAEEQRRYLTVAKRYVDDFSIDSIRVSTRPDAVTDEIAAMLRGYSVDMVELGVQSMSDEVLALSGRGHTAADSEGALVVLRSNGMSVGVQIMPGLPGDTAETVLETARKVAALKPDFVRIYPTLVLKGTPLHKMYLRGEYRPWEIAEMAEACRQAMRIFEAASVRVIRVGLQPTKELVENLVAGPYHPSFRQYIENV